MLLEKISDSRLPYALKALFDAMKFKYKKLYDHVMAVRKQTYKEGVVTTIGTVQYLPYRQASLQQILFFSDCEFVTQQCFFLLPSYLVFNLHNKYFTDQNDHCYRLK